MKNVLTENEKEFLLEFLDRVENYFGNIMDEENDSDMDLMSPKEIFEELSRWVVGQEEAKKILSVAAHNHFKRVMIYNDSQGETKLDKANVLLVGPTGSGKTHLVRTLAKILDVPCYIADANSLTASGYVGKDVDSIVDGLVQEAKGNMDKASVGIVFIDEFDKVRKTSSRSGKADRDVGGESVQQGLLKIIEGTNIEIEKNEGLVKSRYTFDTSFIMVILGGAFVGLEDIIQERLKKENKVQQIGFHKTPPSEEKKTEALKDLKQVDLEEYGFIPEILGRIPSVAVLNELSLEEMVEILSRVENNQVYQYQRLYEYSKNQLEYDSDALTEIASLAISQKRGARGLKFILERMLLDSMFEGKSERINTELVEKYKNSL